MNKGISITSCQHIICSCSVPSHQRPHDCDAVTMAEILRLAARRSHSSSLMGAAGSFPSVFGAFFALLFFFLVVQSRIACLTWSPVTESSLKFVLHFLNLPVLGLWTYTLLACRAKYNSKRNANRIFDDGSVVTNVAQCPHFFNCGLIRSSRAASQTHGGRSFDSMCGKGGGVYFEGRMLRAASKLVDDGCWDPLARLAFHARVG